MDAPRFDALAKQLAAGFSRRRLARGLAALGLAGGAGLGPTPAAAQVIKIPLCDCTECCGCCGDCFNANCCNKCKVTTKLVGIGGWGVVRTAGGEVRVGLVASRVAFADAGAAQLLGQVVWADPTRKLTLASAGLSAYGPLPDAAEAREVRGAMWANDDGPYPFVLRATAGTAEKRARVALAVGDQAVEGGGKTGFTYGAEGELVAGDLRLLDLDLGSGAPATASA